MTAFIQLQIETDDETSAILAAKMVNAARDKRRNLMAVVNHLQGVLSGSKRGIVRTQLASVAATQTVTCDYDTLVLDTDDITIGPTTLSVVTTPSTEDDLAGGSDDATLATNLAAGINAHSVLGELFYATSAAAVVTITSRIAGSLANEVAITETGTSFVVGAGGALTGGVNSTMREDNFGYTR